MKKMYISNFVAYEIIYKKGLIEFLSTSDYFDVIVTQSPKNNFCIILLN